MCSAQNPDEAAEAMTKSLGQWLPDAPAPVPSADGSGDMVVPELVVSDTQRAKMPSYETRTNAARLAIELELYEPALRVLEVQRQEDDEVRGCTGVCVGWEGCEGLGLT